MEYLLSLLPVILVLIGIVVLKKSARNTALLTMIFTIILACFKFQVTGEMVFADIKSGIINALYIAAIIFGAFSLLNLMKISGALNVINNTLLKITNDKRVLIIIVAFGFGAFLEGAAGGGSPASIVTPFLVGLGFEPMLSIVAALLCNGMFAAFGGAGNPVVSGVAPIASDLSVTLASKASGMMLPIIGLVFPFILIYTLYGKNGFKNLGKYLVITGMVYSLTMYLISNYIGPELVALMCGVFIMLSSLAYVKLIGIDTPDEFKYEYSGKTNIEEKYSFFQASSPYLLLLILLPAARFLIPMKILARFGYGTWVGAVIFICASIGTLILKQGHKFKTIVLEALKGVISAFITMVSLLIIANTMKSAGMILTIATGLSHTGAFYPFIAVLIGSLGSFMTGTAAGANIMFAPLHLQTSQLLNLNIAVLFGANNTGSSLGNAICPNNIVAVSTVVGMKNSEGKILNRVLKGWALLVFIGGLVAILINSYSTILGL